MNIPVVPSPWELYAGERDLESVPSRWRAEVEQLMNADAD